jgi:hypothetical protein
LSLFLLGRDELIIYLREPRSTQLERWAVDTGESSSANKDRRKEDTDARRRRRFIDDRRGWIINPFPVAIVSIRPALHIAVAFIPASSLLVTDVVTSPLIFMVIFAEGRPHVYTADHRG